MPHLYTIHFTTRKCVTRYDSAGKEISRIDQDVPVTIKALPLTTARAYEHCDNFSMEIYFAETAPYPMGQRELAKHRFDKPTASKAAKPKPKVDKHEAAKTGDMSAAING